MFLSSKTITECLKDRVESTPDAMALYYKDEAYTWGEVDRITKNLSVELYHIGVRAGHRVGLLGVNSSSWYFYYLALQKMGAEAVLYSTCLKENEIHRSIDFTKTEYLFYSGGYKNESYSRMVASLKGRSLPVKKYLYMEKNARIWKEMADPDWHGKGRSSIRGEYEATVKKIVADIEAYNMNCEQTCSILFTSGTTSNSKGVMLSHKNLVNNAMEMVRSMRWTINDRMCLVVPLFHCFGITACVLSGLIAGFSIDILEHYSTIDVCESIEIRECTILNGVPSMFLAMENNRERAFFDISSLRSGIIAGSPIFRDDYLRILKMFHHDMKLQPSYGQTETSPCISIAGWDDTPEKKAVTSGKPIEGVELRIRDLNDGRILGAGTSGEIEVRGYNVMSGYVNNQCETDKVMTVDGWLKTGDVGFVDKEGYLYVTGRCKNIIIRGGENVSPSEVESSIKEVVQNREVKVLGIPSAVLQEEIVACLECDGSEELEKKILTHLKSRLCGYKIPRYFLFYNELPKNGTGKIDEKTLKLDVISKIDNRIKVHH